MDFNTLGFLLCGEEEPWFLGIFDFSTAPQLLFYSYLPIVIVTLFMGFYVYFKDKKSLHGKLFLSISIFFALWVLNILAQWVASYHTVLMFAWQLTAVFEIGMFLMTTYFAYVFLFKKDLSFGAKFVLWIIGIITILLISTKFNVLSYDLQNCEGNVGLLWNVIYYALEPIFILSIIIMGFVAYWKEHDKLFRKQIILFIMGSGLFLILFFLSNFYGEITQFYEFNFWGPLGMVIFLGLFAYLIVQYHAFNIKLIATQALVWGLVILIGSQFFFIKTPINFILNGTTFAASIVIGYFLIKSVKKEIEQKEQLATLLKQRESLVHLVTHKVKGSFTRTKTLFAGILDGTFGEISPEIRKRAEQGLEFDNGGIKTVDLVLNVANLQNGLIQYDMEQIDFKDLVEQIISEKRIPAEAKGLKFESEIKDDTYGIMGDTTWLKEALSNLVDNSIHYTKEGSIKVGLEKHADKILFSVKDTGVGINNEDKQNLFKEGGRGKKSVEINVDSTGYGLFTVKLIVEAHKGKVSAESEGENKGSQFYVELPTT